MEWQHPQFLYLILPLCTAWLVLALYSDRRRQKARASFVAAAMWSRILPEESRFRFWTKLMLREIAIVAGLVALAGPRFGTQYEQVVPRGSDLYVLIDVSRSMLADDVPPSRLGRAKADVSALLNRLEGERVGLIAFAGQAVVKCPLTIDYDSFRRALEELDPDSAPRGGTAIGDAIRKSLEVFQANADRDQAILLITDGEDQESYPLEAAAVAGERHVTIFAVGLGDAQQGARIPQKGSAKTFVERDGEQVWSKLDSHLLQEIALKTSGVYVPAGTRAYDLGELYVKHLQGRRGNDAASQQRIRRSEQFQMFLAIALAALIVDLCIAPYRRSSPGQNVDDGDNDSQAARKNNVASGTVSRSIVRSACLLAAICSCGTTARATEPDAAVREGLRLYSQDKFDEAREKFATATEELDKRRSAAASVAAFDEACAWHRKGDVERARDAYLRAGLSQDRTLATAAHFNLGTLAAEQARQLAGERPETVPPDKRSEILDQVKQAVAGYRHCLELQPDHAQARRNLELVRQWIKHYSDQWREQDRQKRRDGSNLLEFLEFLIQTQTALKETVRQLPENSRADAFAELKRAQDELREEIPTLREKIGSELRPPATPGTPAPSAEQSKELEEGIAMLQGWADSAGDSMRKASRRLDSRDATAAATDQQAALDELDRIWDAVIPFHPLLARELSDQTTLARILAPQSAGSVPRADGKEPAGENPPEANSTAATADSSPLEIADDDLVKLSELQERTLRKTRLLGPKAQAELERLDSAPPSQSPDQNAPPGNQGAQAQQPPVDPEQAREGFRKAIELAPQAVEQMEAAVTSLKQKDRPTAAQQAEEARRILEEIQKAQPKNEQKQDPQDQQKQDDKEQQQNKSNDDQKQQQKQDDKKDKDQKPDEQQKSEDKQQQEQKQKQAKVSPDRIEDALRKVRERQQEKRERDRKLKGQLLGRTPVDKDW